MLTVARDALRAELAAATRLLRLYAGADPSFLEAAVAWFESATSSASKLSSRTRSAIARESAYAMSSARGYRDPALPADLPSRRARIVTLGLCVARAQVMLEDELRSVESRLEVITEKLVQLLAVAAREIPLTFEEGADVRSQAVALWATLTRHSQETILMVNYIRLALEPGDRVALIAELLERAVADKPVLRAAR